MSHYGRRTLQMLSFSHCKLFIHHALRPFSLPDSVTGRLFVTSKIGRANSKFSTPKTIHSILHLLHLTVQPVWPTVMLILAFYIDLGRPI